MRELLHSLRRNPVDDATASALTAKCQENDWLRRGGYDWQDDPYMEEYPYDYMRAENMEDLRRFFMHKNWAIRQGVLFEDVAFIQQVNGGDEWWVLKCAGRSDDPTSWVGFESMSMGYVADMKEEFDHCVTSLAISTAQECRARDYVLPDLDEPWAFSSTDAIDFSHKLQHCKSIHSRIGDYVIKVYEKPSIEGFTLEVFNQESRCTILSVDNLSLPGGAVKIGKAAALTMAERGIETMEQWRNFDSSLSAKAHSARAAAASFPEKAQTLTRHSRDIS